MFLNRNRRTVAKSRILHTVRKMAILRPSWPVIVSETDQTAIINCVAVGRTVALPEAKQFEFADQLPESGIAAEGAMSGDHIRVILAVAS